MKAHIKPEQRIIYVLGGLFFLFISVSNPNVSLWDYGFDVISFIIFIWALSIAIINKPRISFDELGITIWRFPYLKNSIKHLSWKSVATFNLLVEYHERNIYTLEIYENWSEKPMKINIGILDTDHTEVFQEFRRIANANGVYEFKKDEY